MDFKFIKDKANKLKAKAIELKDKAVDYSSDKLASSSMTINTKENLDEIIAKSKNTSFTNEETQITKNYTKRSIVIYAEEKSEFFKDLLYILPVIYTKAFSQNIPVKLAKSKIKGVVLKKYQVDTIPSLVVYENTNVYKTIVGNENILKLVKNFTMDINELVDNIKVDEIKKEVKKTRKPKIKKSIVKKKVTTKKITTK